MQNPPLTEGGQRRPLSDLCQVIIHDTDAGLALVVENKDPREITLKFDFGGCENLEMKRAEGIEDAGPMRCNTVAKTGTALNLCELIVAAGATSFGMKYRVQCLVRNSRGELEQVRPGDAAGAKAASSSAASSSAGGGGGGAPGEGEEVKKITDQLSLIIAPGPNHGYNILFTSTNPDTSVVSVDFGKSENLAVTAAPGMTIVEGLRVNGEIEKGERIPFASLAVKDFSLGSCSLQYKISQRSDSTKRLAKEAAEQKAREEEAARLAAEAEKARQEAEAAAAKDAAEAAAARERTERLAREEEERKKREQEEAERREAEAEAARKAAEEEAARQKAEEEAKRKAAEEAARKAAEAKAKADAEAAQKAAEEEARLRAEAEAAEEARREAERKRIALAIEKMHKEEYRIRIKFEAEWHAYYLRIVKMKREALCCLCRRPFPEGYTDIVNYKDTYRIRKECFEKASKCYVCGDILIGEYVQTKRPDGTVIKLKKTCIEAYKKGSRPQCSYCGTQIMEDKWYTTPDGKHYKMDCRAKAGV